MRTLPPSLKKGPGALASRTPSDETFLLGTAERGVLVRAITPVLGGGVESFVPDTVDVVRVPSIRGAVRWWWRALQPALSTDELREAERRVWGGVGKDGDETSSASPVRIDVRVTKSAKGDPAGFHVARREGGLKALPDWKGGTAFGYGLFPLQRTGDERRAFAGSGDMPTRLVRRELEFELRVRVIERGAQPLSAEDRALVLDATRLWLTFGGYGARTRRGFGALHSNAVSYEEVVRILSRVRGAPPADRPTLAGCMLFEGRSQPTPVDAHRATLDALRLFRQDTSFGRNPGTDKPYGRSRWPEPDSLRVLTRRHFRIHRPAQSLKQPSAPRAAFGLPIQVTFIKGEDEAANGVISATRDGGRWASPLLIRPVCIGNEFVPVALILRGHRPSRAWMECQGTSTLVDVTYVDDVHGGAHGVVRDALTHANGDALEAFAGWLVSSRGFRRVGGER